MVAINLDIDLLANSYMEHLSSRKVGKLFGVSSRTILNRLSPLGIIIKRPKNIPYSDEAILIIKENYKKYAEKGMLKDLADLLNRSVAGIKDIAVRLGLSSTENLIRSAITKMKLGKTGYQSNLRGWREFPEYKKYYLKSSYEINFAKILQYRKEQGEIKDWFYETETFWFKGISRGINNYTPDFLIIYNDNSEEYVEIKGWYTAESKTKTKRMAKYHQNVKLTLILTPEYKELLKQYDNVITDFEFPEKKAKKVD